MSTAHWGWGCKATGLWHCVIADDCTWVRAVSNGAAVDVAVAIDACVASVFDASVA